MSPKVSPGAAPTALEESDSVAAQYFNVHQAKTQLSTLLKHVEQGAEIVISRAGVPVARLVPFTREIDLPGYGSLKGQIFLAEDWDSDETNDAIAQDFGLID